MRPKLLARLFLVAWTAVLALHGQDNDPAPVQPRGGFQLLNLSAYTVYYTNGLPAGIQPLGAFVNLNSDVGLGVGGAIGYSRSRERSSIVFTYTGSYDARVRYSVWNASSHAATLSLMRKLAPRWTAGLAASGGLSGIDRYLFAPDSFSGVASATVPFGDLTNTVLGGQFNSQLTPIFSGASAQSPIRTLLFGERIFSANAQGYLGYSWSPRLNVSFKAGAIRSQHVSDNLNLPQNGFLIANTTSGSAAVNVSYSLSPNTQIGGALATERISSSLQNFYSVSSVASLGRTFSPHWLVQLRGGVGVAKPVGASSFSSTGPHPILGATLAVHTYSHNFFASYDRIVSDSFGLGAVTSSVTGAGWRWRHPGSSWWLEGSGDYQKLAGGFLGDFSGWHVTGGWGRSMGRFSLLAQYTHLFYSAANLQNTTLQNSGYNIAQSAIRLSLTWNPNPAVPR